MKKKIITTATALGLSLSIGINAFAMSDLGGHWGVNDIKYLMEHNIIKGYSDNTFRPDNHIKRSEFLKMVNEVFEVKGVGNISFSDVKEGSWYYEDVAKAVNAGYVDGYSDNTFRPNENISRQDAAKLIVVAAGLENHPIKNKTSFKDAKDIDDWAKPHINIIVDKGYMSGYKDNTFKPKDKLTRAEAARILTSVRREIKNDPVKEEDLSINNIVSPTRTSVEKAQRWAKNRGAHQRFINIAPTYWKYGRITGINPEILYAQAAKETNFGKYTGSVKPEMNNWAGIKIANPKGDNTYDHETFATPDDGVRAHFNHMGIYVGVDPVGKPHPRWYVTSKVGWAGKVKTVEELGGKWAPSKDYGVSIMRDYVEHIYKIK